MDTFDIVIVLIGVAVLLIVGVLFLLSELQYKIRFRRLVMIGGNNKQIVEDRAKIINEKGRKRWHLRKARMNVPAPPPDVILSDQRGKWHVDAYYTGNEHKYRLDTTSLDDIKAAHVEALGSYEPVTSDDRDFYLSELEEASKYGMGDFLNKYGGVMVAGTFMIAFFVIIAATYGEFIAPLNENTVRWDSISANLLDASENLQALNAGRGGVQVVPNRLVNESGVSG